MGLKLPLTVSQEEQIHCKAIDLRLIPAPERVRDWTWPPHNGRCPPRFGNFEWALGKALDFCPVIDAQLLGPGVSPCKFRIESFPKSGIQWCLVAAQ